MNAGVPGISGFRDFVCSLGYEPPERIEPGRWFRFSTNGKRGDSAGSARLFPDCEGGIVFDWRTGESQTWQAKRERPRTAEEQRVYREKCERERQAAQAKRERELRETAERAARIWKESQQADDAHGYHKLKGIRCHGARLYRGNLALREQRCDGALVIPRRTASGDLVSLQFIPVDGKEKRYLNGPVPSGSYFSIGKPDEVLCVAEGYATAASVHEATGHAVAVCFDAGNMEAVGRALRDKLPNVRLIFCADDDWKVTRNGEPYNPGMEAAIAAARATGAYVAVPGFGADRPDSATDFNDLHKLQGLETVRKAIDAAEPSQVSEPQPTPVNRSGAVLAREWPGPKPIPDGLRPVAPFDYGLLPQTVRPWGRDICERMQCPPDFVAVSLMAALGSVIGRQVAIRPQAKTDWCETPNLWAMLIGRPGLMKSPATEQATAPVRRLQAEAADRYGQEREEYEREARAVKLKQEAGEKAARKKLAQSYSANVADELSIPDLEEPRPKRYIVNDSTYEAIGETHRGNPNGVLVYRDELVSLLQYLDREDNSAARGFFLSGWSGKQSYDFDRITRKGARLEAVCLSMLGSTQPGRIAAYVRMAVKGGAGDDGLLQRFGLMVWPDVSPEWRAVDREPDHEARRVAFEAFKRLDAIDPKQIDAEQDKDFNGEPDGLPYLRLDPDALAMFSEWHRALELRLRGSSEEPALESHFSKYRKLIPSLALVLHLAAGSRGPVGSGAMLQALAWGEYLESHARRVYASITGPVNTAAKAIIERIRRGDLARDDGGQPAPFHARDVYRAGWAHLSDREVVHEAIDLLTDLDWIEGEAVNAGSLRGGRPTTQYHVNPRGLR